MIIIRECPPLWDEITAAFPVARTPGVIFSWGDCIYNPSGIEISRPLLVHERVHCVRQRDDVEGWWRRYIADPEFRLAEEIPAHVAEARSACVGQTRHGRRAAVAGIAHRLASPLYGRLLTLDKAEALLRRALKEAA